MYCTYIHFNIFGIVWITVNSLRYILKEWKKCLYYINVIIQQSNIFFPKYTKKPYLSTKKSDYFCSYLNIQLCESTNSTNSLTTNSLSTTIALFLNWSIREPAISFQWLNLGPLALFQTQLLWYSFIREGHEA